MWVLTRPDRPEVASGLGRSPVDLLAEGDDPRDRWQEEQRAADVVDDADAVGVGDGAAYGDAHEPGGAQAERARQTLSTPVALVMSDRP